MNLPKGWKHWCQQNGLRPDTNTRYARKRDNWAYLKGHGRRWRVNCDTRFQVSCREENFDRWANSLEADTDMPYAPEEMTAAVEMLLEDCRDR